MRGQLEESLELCRDIIADPWEEAEQEFVERYIRSSPSWPEGILELYDRKQGIASDLVHWKYLPREMVQRSVRTLPRDHLAAIFDKLSEYTGGNKSGFPDLIVFSPSGRRKAPAYELIEVKGPGGPAAGQSETLVEILQQPGDPLPGDSGAMAGTGKMTAR
jgi:hypothetical protein